MPFRTSTALPLAAALALLAGPALAQDDEEENLLAFNSHCRQCHVTNEDDHRLGPSLYNIIGREAGTAEGYGYSSAMENADHVWDEETLNSFIEDPDAVVPGNNMQPFAGVPSEEERAKIIAHLVAESEE